MINSYIWENLSHSLWKNVFDWVGIFVSSEVQHWRHLPKHYLMNFSHLTHRVFDNISMPKSASLSYHLDHDFAQSMCHFMPIT